VKKTREDEPIGVVVHICMKTTQGNFRCSYLYLKLAKASCFSFYLFSSTKSEKKRVEQEVSHRWEGQVAAKGVRG
jgi:hypothetical protein